MGNRLELGIFSFTTTMYIPCIYFLCCQYYSKVLLFVYFLSHTLSLSSYLCIKLFLSSWSRAHDRPETHNPREGGRRGAGPRAARSWAPPLGRPLRRPACLILVLYRVANHCVPPVPLQDHLQRVLRRPGQGQVKVRDHILINWTLSLMSVSMFNCSLALVDSIYVLIKLIHNCAIKIMFAFLG